MFVCIVCLPKMPAMFLATVALTILLTSKNKKQETKNTRERDREMQFDMLNICVLLIFIETRRDVGIDI